MSHIGHDVLWLLIGCKPRPAKTVKAEAAHIDSVDLLVVDVESSLGQLLLPGIKALQVAFIVTHKPAPQVCM